MWSAAVDSFGKKATCQRLECQRQQQQHWWRWDGEWWKLPACPLQHSSIPCSSSSSSIPCLAPALHSTLTTTTVHSISPRSVPAEGCWCSTDMRWRRQLIDAITMRCWRWMWCTDSLLVLTRTRMDWWWCWSSTGWKSSDGLSDSAAAPNLQLRRTLTNGSRCKLLPSLIYLTFPFYSKVGHLIPGILTF